MTTTVSPSRVRAIDSSRSSAIATPAAAHASTMALCQPASGPSNHSRTDAAIVGPTPSVPASVSSDASRTAVIDAELGGQRAGRGRTDVADRQRDQHPPQRHRGLALVEVGQQACAVGGELRPLLALLGGAGEERGREQRRLVEVEEVALVGDRARVEQRDRRLVAEALDVEGTATGDVEDPLAHLGRALLVVGAAEVLVALLLLGQRRSAQAGHVVGIRHGFRPFGRSASTGPRISGITSPALRRITVSPGRTSLRLTSWALCRVAFSTVEPATLVGSMTP